MNLAPSQGTCPHCKSDARPAADATLKLKCAACGRPRLPAALTFAGPESRSTQLLELAGKQRVRAGALKISAWALSVLSAMALMTTMLVLWAFDVGSGFSVALSVLALMPVFLTVLSVLGSRKSARNAEQGVEEAWSNAVRELYTARSGALSERQLVEYGVNPDSASTWLAEAELGDYLADGPRLRVDEYQERDTDSDQELLRDAELETEAAVSGRSASRDD